MKTCDWFNPNLSFSWFGWFISVGRWWGQRSCDITVTNTFFWPPHQLRDKEAKKKKKRADKESDRKQRVTEFNKVQQGRKDCTSGEKQLAFTTSADLNAFTPPPPSPPFYQRLHSSADSPKGEHRRRRSFPRFLFECWPRTATICANVHEALRHLPAVNIRPGSRSLSDNSQLPNWLRLFSFGGYKCSFAQR